MRATVNEDSSYSYKILLLRSGARVTREISHFAYCFRTSTPFRKKHSDHFKDLHKLTLLTHFDIILTSFLGGIINYVLIHNSFW